tara:strand:- start:13932 stop:14540 length:609 start_codon:yes stop_codon:yes gene_type:complete
MGSVNMMDMFGYLVIGSLLFICFYTYLDNMHSFDLKCVVSSVNGNKYCVRERKQVDKAADLLASTASRCQELVDYVAKKYPDNENIQKMKEKFNPKNISETLPTSEYTAYSENKGEKLAFCLNTEKNDNDKLIDGDTLLFVAIHELSHIMTKSIGHKTEFWDNFKFLLKEAQEANIHNPVDYKKNPKQYCSMKIRDNPYYDK